MDPAGNGGKNTPRCLVEFSSLSDVDLGGYRHLGYGYGTLGLVTLDDAVFLCIVTGFSPAATLRPGETVLRIESVDFCMFRGLAFCRVILTVAVCLSNASYESLLSEESEGQYPTDELTRVLGLEDREGPTDHPFLALKKLLSDGSFYYSLDFDITQRLQDRYDTHALRGLNKPQNLDINADEDMLWNSYMIKPLLLFRSRLPEKLEFDSSHFLTWVIRGFASTIPVSAAAPGLAQSHIQEPSLLTVISRQSWRRAGTRFNARGVDDDGNVANFVQTETVFWIPPDITFSYAQIRGSVPIFWEQAPGFLPGQQRIDVSRSVEATQPAFDHHFGFLGSKYGSVHVINLLSKEKRGEAELSTKLREHIAKSPVEAEAFSDRQVTEFDFHAECRGPLGYGATAHLESELAHALHDFMYFLGISTETSISESQGSSQSGLSAVSQQRGVFRTNCLDCLDRTNYVQTIMSSAALGSFLRHQGGTLTSSLQRAHSTVWADNGDALSSIYAGTGALKSSFTRNGKVSFAGALSDVRKSATRLYVNNFSDNLRQKTIDLLLGRLAKQIPVQLYDPINDLVAEELEGRASEYTSTKPITIWTGTFNLTGRNIESSKADLAPWLFSTTLHQPTIFAVAFQEIVPLSPQQIMSTDPTTRKAWETAVRNCLNPELEGISDYVLLRSSQLVGTALMIFVRADALHEIRHVEASTKKASLLRLSWYYGY